jgi:hypothetical protein
MLPSMTPGERRREERSDTARRRCCVIASDKVAMAQLLSFSIGGARFQSLGDFAVGERLRYFWKANCCMEAEVAWREETTYGLRHVDVSADTGSAFPARPVRIDCRAPAECSVDGQPRPGIVENISLGGLRISGVPGLATGQKVAVRLCSHTILPASVRWLQHGVAGLKLDEPMSPVTLQGLLLDARFAFADDAPPPGPLR